MTSGRSKTLVPEDLRTTDPEKYAMLRAEAMAPYKGLRQFIYVGLGASAAFGGFVFFAQILAGRNLDTALPNFALQSGVVALMVLLYRYEQNRKMRLVEGWRRKLDRDRKNK